MSAQAGVHAAVLAVLKASAAVAAVVAVDPDAGSPSEPSVFDHVLQGSAAEDNSRFPYIVVGENTSQDFDADDFHGQETTLTLHVWDRYRGRKRQRQVLDAIYDTLHDKAESLSVSGQKVISCFWEFSQALQEDGPINQHAVTRFRIVTQES